MISIFYDPIFFPVLCAYVASLLGKVLTHSWVRKRLTFTEVLKDGGMPSSHTAFVTGLTTAVFLHEGVSTLFWVTTAFSSIVMHDALGVRFETGRQGKAINAILQTLNPVHKTKMKELREVMGHTPSQVLFGLIIGVLVSWGVYSLILF